MLEEPLVFVCLLSLIYYILFQVLVFEDENNKKENKKNNAMISLTMSPFICRSWVFNSTVSWNRKTRKTRIYSHICIVESWSKVVQKSSHISFLTGGSENTRTTWHVFTLLGIIRLVRRHKMWENLSQQVPTFIGWTRESHQHSQQITCGATERSETSEKLEVLVLSTFGTISKISKREKSRCYIDISLFLS